MNRSQKKQLYNYYIRLIEIEGKSIRQIAREEGIDSSIISSFLRSNGYSRKKIKQDRKLQVLQELQSLIPDDPSKLDGSLIKKLHQFLLDNGYKNNVTRTKIISQYIPNLLSVSKLGLTTEKTQSKYVKGLIINNWQLMENVRFKNNSCHCKISCKCLLCGEIYERHFNNIISGQSKGCRKCGYKIRTGSKYKK